MITIPDGPLSKLKRAVYHIDDLERLIAEYLAKRPIKLFICQRRKTATKSLEFKTEKRVPLEFAAIIGDAIHNLRSALDLLAFDLVGDKAPKPEKIYFPFSKKSDPASLLAEIKSRCMDLAGSDVVDVIVSLRPYLGGNSLLFGLHQLDIIDKHKLLLPVGHTSQLTADQIKLLIPESVIRGPGTLVFFCGDEPIASLKLLGNRDQRRAIKNFEREAGIQPRIDLCFGKETPFEGHEVISKLREIAAEVERAMNQIVSARIP